ncbi:LOW QUALITY PROTEIN: Pollen_Ole_e_I domain-containing protein, partial [Cephalotus follicularis]
VVMLIATTLFMRCTNLIMAAVESKVFHVDGEVLFQDCTKSYNEWVSGATPVKGCVVSLTCMDERRKIVYCGSDVTVRGQFEMMLNKYKYGKELKAELCVRLVSSSPHPPCHIATHFAG